MEQGAACLDLVTPTHFTDAVLEALGDGALAGAGGLELRRV